ncbi:hypothetical protein TREMEDRAFT_27142 [Tremella mesenterica DSM 1558]|uniref:uncharacterized protein n=1 Tax=Tremella mesenterica (strain ATCC 24925 / CBS 8224 / DSM 1558 / NBRC 9311 / NRRL Y-6157 / RJB 2259-6 / UBC 559-6) TaxID=578456 RepID=UPI0003F49B11|nr:uncharacterized protein TREMEDRAFT_27142 [Tremella mesenterica DSM 1558]EIW71658.1 hypothetical protein TREMEDRAFT_27142 [Tremella mesenterica DSM 1558]
MDHDDHTTLSKYTLYETKGRLIIAASSGDVHKVLKIDRTDPTGLSVVQDPTTYTHRELEQLLLMIKDGNKSQGGLEKVMDFYGLIGFVRFTAGWYLIGIAKRSVVGLLGGHYIYHCDETAVLPIPTKPDRSSQETKLLATFQTVDLTKNFYFSYSYDITNTLQTNLTISDADRKWNSRFMWNHRLLTPAFDLDAPRGQSRWILPMIRGFVDQAKIQVFTRTIYLTLLARRSRFYAGARYLTRGVNENGHVANEVETEQIVSEPLATGFGIEHGKANKAAYGGYTSFVQYRGSIPVMWHQESNQMTPRPPIEITIKDPFYTPAAKHFDDLLGRYGAPIYILNLVKSRESVPRESKLLYEYGQCVQYLNQFLPEGKKMVYIAWDMAQATKNGHQDIMGVLEDICEESLAATNFFHGGSSRSQQGEQQRRVGPLLQQGILRTNCVDCLDRTNAAQFAIAKRALGHQLFSLGFLSAPDKLPFNCDAVDVLTEMYHDHGDTLAWQYTGSALVNRVDTYRRTKATQWTSHSRDLLENIRRFYTNSMLDADKQAAINLFLGVEPSAPVYKADRPHYRQWFTPSHLDPPKVEVLEPVNEVFKEYYKPHILSQLDRLYAFTMNSTNRFHARSKGDHGNSPFTSRNRPLRSTTAMDDTSSIPEPRRSETDNKPNSSEIKSDPHPIETLISSLLDPPDIDQRAQEYDWYTHYHADELVSSHTIGEEKDLQLYLRAAQLAEGQDVERLLDVEGSGNVVSNWIISDNREKWEMKDEVMVPRVNVQLYEKWSET